MRKENQDFQRRQRFSHRFAHIISEFAQVSDQDAQIAGMPGRYASALFALAREENALDDVAKDLAAIAAMIDKSADLERLVKSPVFSAEEQIRAIMAVLEKSKITKLTANFVGLVTKNRRLFAIGNMIKAYNGLLARHRGEISAEVTSAQDLSQKQIEALKATLKSAMGRDVNLDVIIDETLLGGLIVKVGSRMVDTSLKTKLDKLRYAMKEVG